MIDEEVFWEEFDNLMLRLLLLPLLLVDWKKKMKGRVKK
jgi:hypothetical protein